LTFNPPKNVDEGCLTRCLLRSIGSDEKSRAGEGKPALIPPETNGSSSLVSVFAEKYPVLMMNEVLTLSFFYFKMLHYCLLAKRMHSKNIKAKKYIYLSKYQSS